MKHPVLTPTLVLIILILTGIVMSTCNSNKNSSSLQHAKIYVANKEDSSVSVIDLQESMKNTNIDLSDSGKMLMAHNVQVV